MTIYYNFEILQFLSTRQFARKPYYLFLLPPSIIDKISVPNYCNTFEDLPV